MVGCRERLGMGWGVAVWPWWRPAGGQPQDSHVPVPEGGDEVQAAVHPVVLDVLAVEATLIPKVLLKLLVHIVSDGLPAAGRRVHEARPRGRPASLRQVRSAWAEIIPQLGLAHH